MMTMAKPRSLVWSRWAPLALTIVVATVAIDQASKWWMLSVYDIASKGRVEVLPFLDLVFVKNIGISYSLFNQESVLGQYLLAGFAFVASMALWAWLNRSSANRLMAVSLALIIGGAIGNAIDRAQNWRRRRLFLAARLWILLVRLQHRRCGHRCWRCGAIV